jgi:hypothetical protein
MKFKIIAMMAVFFGICLASPLQAGNKGEKEDWFKKSIEKEVGRAKESASYNGDSQRLEEKYGHLKETHPKEYEAMMQARKNAAATWQSVAKKLRTAKDYEEIQEYKISGYEAQDIADLAHFEMKSAESISRWSKSAEKVDSKKIKAMTQQLIKKQQDLTQATIQKMLAEKSRRQFDLERRKLEAEMRKVYDSERKASYEKKNKK